MVCLNQVREKIGVMYGSPLTTPGGRALPHAASIRISMLSSAGDAIKESKDVVGYGFRMKIIKNKVSAPYKEANFQLLYDGGIQRTDNLIDVAIKLGIIEKAGAWLKYDGEQYHGKAGIVEAVKSQDFLLEKITGEIYAKPSDVADSVEDGSSGEQTTTTSET
jgi:recombination protein RecA